jgi:hypothetical protein
MKDLPCFVAAISRFFKEIVKIPTNKGVTNFHQPQTPNHHELYPISSPTVPPIR